MNKLVIIGNGFDLAHNLKTSYSDFLVWYLNNAHEKFYEDMTYEDDLIKISNAYGVEKVGEFNSINDYIKSRELDDKLRIEFKHDFFRELIDHTYELNWVDIEYQYYQNVLSLFKRKSEDIYSDEQVHKEDIKELNSNFEAIKHKLIEYLNTIDTKDVENKRISNNLRDFIRTESGEHENICILNFNYTSTIENYLNLIKVRSRNEVNIINIHGKLKDEHNPIIFGYGDEMDPNYNAIENLNENEYLKYIKSFNYFKTDNYQSFNRFIDSTVFDVFIFGHSCGISDRILLNSIFEHKYCNKIRIFYYKKDDANNDYFEKTQEISRHFKAENKSDMRNKVISFKESCPIC